jgi:hypothetical protein
MPLKYLQALISNLSTVIISRIYSIQYRWFTVFQEDRIRNQSPKKQTFVEALSAGAFGAARL